MQKPTRYYSSKQEKRVAANLGLKVTKNSGAGAFAKGDATNEFLLMECKTTTKPVKSVSIKKEWLEKNREEMFNTGKEMSAVAFDFGDGKDYAILEMADFKLLIELYKEFREGDE